MALAHPTGSTPNDRSDTTVLPIAETGRLVFSGANTGTVVVDPAAGTATQVSAASFGPYGLYAPMRRAPNSPRCRRAITGAAPSG